MTPPLVAIVDDDPAIRTALTRLTRSLGYRPEAYESAEALLSAFHEVQPVCVVTDVQMPGLSGLDLLRMVQLQKPDIPVIVITAYPSGSTRERALAAGAFAYLAKPFDGDEFERCLGAVFAAR